MSGFGRIAKGHYEILSLIIISWARRTEWGGGDREIDDEWGRDTKKYGKKDIRKERETYESTLKFLVIDGREILQRSSISSKIDSNVCFSDSDQVRSGLWTELGWTELDCTGLDLTGLVWAGLDWTGLSVYLSCISFNSFVSERSDDRSDECYWSFYLSICPSAFIDSKFVDRTLTCCMRTKTRSKLESKFQTSIDKTIVLHVSTDYYALTDWADFNIFKKLKKRNINK